MSHWKSAFLSRERPQKNCIVFWVILDFSGLVVIIEAWIDWLKEGKRKTKALDEFEVLQFFMSLSFVMQAVKVW